MPDNINTNEPFDKYERIPQEVEYGLEDDSKDRNWETQFHNPDIKETKK